MERGDVEEERQLEKEETDSDSNVQRKKKGGLHKLHRAGQIQAADGSDMKAQRANLPLKRAVHHQGKQTIILHSSIHRTDFCKFFK